MLSRLSKQKDSAKEEITYKSVETQADTQDQNFTATELAQCEQDEKVPWDSPSMQAPLCSWSSFPLEPSQTLKLLVDFFTPQDSI